MDKEWIRLTLGTEDNACVLLYKRNGSRHKLVDGKQVEGKFLKGIWPDQQHFSTTELANIPWVRALVVAAREMTYRRDIYLDEENDDSLTEVWVYKEDTLERLHAALKPFEGVDYE